MIPKPLNDRIIVDPENPPEISEGGIHIPPNAQQRSDKGVVLAVGPGRLMDSSQFGQPSPHVTREEFQKGLPRIPMTVKVGDKVLFAMYAGQEIEIDGKKLKVMTEDDILGIVEE